MPHAQPVPPNLVRRGLWFGLLGVAIFALTAPMTRLAVGPAGDAQLQPGFVAAGRAALAGLLSVAYLLWTKSPWPNTRHLPAMVVCAAGTVLGFPLFQGLALRHVDAVHAAVMNGVLPLATAVAASWFFRQRASKGFWWCAIAGCALVLAFAARAGNGLSAADGLLLLAVASAAVGYVAGARLSTQWSPERAICWVLVGCLPFTLPIAWATWPVASVRASAWAGFAYLSVFSMWLGFFAWYRGLALGGSLRVSQVQLAQPFLSMLAAVPLLGERFDAETVLFLLAVMATVVIGKRMPVGDALPSSSSPVALR